MNAVLCRTIVVLVLVGSVADGQTLSSPSRSVEGIFGGRRPAASDVSHQELTLTMSFLGGFDDNLSPDGTASGVSANPLAPRESGYTGIAAGELTYWRGRTTRFLEASGRAQLTTNSEQFTEPLIGGDARVEGANRELGRMGVDVSASAQYRPTFALGAFGPVASDVEAGAVPETDPTAGVSEMSSFIAGVSASGDRAWTRRQRTAIGYDFSRRRFTGRGGLDSRTHGGRVSHTWEFLRIANARLAYQYSNEVIQQVQERDRPLQTHNADLGVEFRRRYSPTRTLVLSLGGGANHVRTRAATDERRLEYTVPSVYGTVRLDLARTWAMSADVRRSVSVLDGLSAQSFVTKVVALRTGGRITGDLSVALAVGFSQGTAPAGQVGSFESLNGSLQFDYNVTRWCSLVTSYMYYDHLLRGLTGIPEGFPRRFDRNTVRVGMTIWLPLYGSFQSERGRSRGSD